jgi:hypothetical protein
VETVRVNYKMTKFIEQSCGGCVVRVEAWKPDLSDDIEGFIGVQVISNHSSREHTLMSNRVKNAWKALRGSYDWSGFDLMTHEEAEKFSKAVDEASDAAWPRSVNL